MAEKSLSDVSKNEPSKKWSEIYNELEKNYREAYFTIDKAVKIDEEGNIEDALSLYELGLCLIDKALGIPISEPAQPDLSWEKTLAMTQKLRKTRKEITIRIDAVRAKPELVQTEPPPSYKDAVYEAGLKSDKIDVGNDGNNFQLPGSSKNGDPYISPSMIHDPLLLANLDINVENIISPQNGGVSQHISDVKFAKNEEILFSCNNVLLYFIAPDGRVSSTSEPNVLIFARLHDENSDERTFLQVGSWVYPLIPEVSPCTRSINGAFILPDVNANLEGAAVGIVVPPEVEEEVHEVFNTLLNEIKASGRARRSAPIDSGSRLVRGATYVASNLIRGAGNTAKFLNSSTPKVIDNITPQPKPTEINENLQKTFEVAKVVSAKAVDVTDYLATKVGMATAALGRYLYPHVQKQGSKLLTTATNMPAQEASQKINTVLGAVANAAEGVSIVYGGLNTAASILAQSLSNNTVQIVEHKYGQSAGVLTNNAFATVGNIYYVKHNYRALKPKGFAKAALRGASSAVLEDYRNSKIQERENFNNS